MSTTLMWSLPLARLPLSCPHSLARSIFTLVPSKRPQQVYKSTGLGLPPCYSTSQAGEVQLPSTAGEEAPLPSGLYVVATPIGCLEDITLRAIRVLRTADRILCEDTRRSGILLNHFGIKTPMTSYHMHNETQKLKKARPLIAIFWYSKVAYVLYNDVTASKFPSFPCVLFR